VRELSKRLLTMETRTGSDCARKPRRDRIRRGAGSGTREVLGPRARGFRYDGRVSGSWMRLSKPGTSLRLWPRRLMRREPQGARSQLMAQVTEMRSPVPLWRRRHSEVGTVSAAPPAGVLVRESTVRGVGTHGAELHNCGAGVGDVRPRGVRAAFSQGGREPGGMRHAECTGIVATEAGDG